MVTLSITTVWVDAPERLATLLIFSTTSSPFTTSPKCEYSGGNRSPSAADHEELLPFVLGPALAIAGEPTLSLPLGSSSAKR